MRLVHIWSATRYLSRLENLRVEQPLPNSLTSQSLVRCDVSGAGGDRTLDILFKRQELYLLSYGTKW